VNDQTLWQIWSPDSPPFPGSPIPIPISIPPLASLAEARRLWRAHCRNATSQRSFQDRDLPRRWDWLTSITGWFDSLNVMPGTIEGRFAIKYDVFCLRPAVKAGSDLYPRIALSLCSGCGVPPRKFGELPSYKEFLRLTK